jgi:hypothetical protein
MVKELTNFSIYKEFKIIKNIVEMRKLYIYNVTHLIIHIKYRNYA